MALSSSPQPISYAQAPKGSYIADFNRSWTRRLNGLRAAGIDDKSVIPVIRADWQRIQAGSSPYSNIEAGLAIRSVRGGGKPIIETESRGSGILDFFGNIPQDAGDIMGSLNPWKIAKGVYGQVDEAISHPEKVFKPFGTLASGDVGKAFKQASRAPLLSLVPGVYTAKNVLTGDFGEIAKHPVMTMLDLLPYAGKAGKLAMAGKALEGSEQAANLAARGALKGTFEAGSPAEALAAGRPFKAAFRASLGTTEGYNPLDVLSTRPVSEANRRVAMQAKDVARELEKVGVEPPAAPTVWRAQDYAKKIAELGHFDAERRALGRASRLAKRWMGVNGEKVWATMNKPIEHLTAEERSLLLDVAQRYQPGSDIAYLPDGKGGWVQHAVTDEQRSALTFFRDQAEQYGEQAVEQSALGQSVSPGQLRRIAETGEYVDSSGQLVDEGVQVDRTTGRLSKVDPDTNEGLVVNPATGEREFYALEDPVMVSQRRYLDAQEKLAPAEREFLAMRDDLVSRYGTDFEKNATPEELKAYGAAEKEYESLHQAREKAFDDYADKYRRKSPTRYEASLKDEVVQRIINEKIEGNTADKVLPVYRYTNRAIAEDIANPQGAFVASDPRDFEAVSGGRALQETELRPRNRLDVNASSAMQSLGEATLEHFNYGGEARVIADRVRAGDVRGAIDFAEQSLGIKLTDAEKQAILAADVSPGQMMDIAGAKLAQKYGHDVVFKNVPVEGVPGSWRMHEATVLDENALLSAQKEPVLAADEAAKFVDDATRGEFQSLVDRHLITEGELHGIIDDVRSGWQELKAKGYDPVFVPYVPTSKTKYLLDQKPLLGNQYTPRQFLTKETLSFAPRAQDLAIGMTSYAVELLKKEASKELFGLVKDHGVTQAQLASWYGHDAARDILDKRYIPFSESAGRYLAKPELDLIPDADKLYIPRSLNYTLNDIMSNQFEKHGLKAAYDKGMGVYKYAVLTGPRHIAHVLFGGMMFQGLEHPGALLKWFEGAKMVKEGRLPFELPRGMDTFTPEELATIGQGKTQARLWAKVAGSPFHAMRKFEEWIADTQRAASYIYELERGGKSGLSQEAAHQAAIEATNKVFIDIDGMAPIERSILRQIFPFYTFTRHIMRYAIRYPADHPWRAATLANIARIESEDHKTGLPTMFNDFFFFGKPDEEGNVSGINLHNLNPFRSFEGANPLTLAGFMAALNPLITVPVNAAGLNTLTGTPELYPDLTYDDRTGKLVASHNGVIPQMIQGFLPPTGAVQGIFQLTEDWKRLKKSDPDAYQRAIWSSLNLPFTPQNRNLNVEAYKTELNRYRAGQAVARKAIKTGNTEPLKNYNLVPFQGQLVPANRLADLLDRLKKISPTGSPGSIIPHSHGKNDPLVEYLLGQGR